LPLLLRFQLIFMFGNFSLYPLVSSRLDCLSIFSFFSFIFYLTLLSFRPKLSYLSVNLVISKPKPRMLFVFLESQFFISSPFNNINFGIDYNIFSFKLNNAFLFISTFLAHFSIYQISFHTNANSTQKLSLFDLYGLCFGVVDQQNL
jgi:hypothetical protein